MSAITVFVAALALTSPPAAAPTDRQATPVFGPVAALEADPLLGPWSFAPTFAPRPQPQDFPAAQHGGTASTPAAVLPAAGVLAVRLIRQVRTAASMFWELLCRGSTAIRTGARWLQQAPWSARSVPELPVIRPDGFSDILNFGGTLRSARQLPLADANATKGIRDMTPNQLRLLRTVTVIADRGARAAQTRTAKPRDGPYRLRAAAGRQGLPASCF